MISFPPIHKAVYSFQCFHCRFSVRHIVEQYRLYFLVRCLSCGAISVFCDFGIGRPKQ